jgi:MSHA biogenesis protein MshN
MSLINQVLNELEKRGANSPFQDMPIRAVHANNRAPLWRYFAGIALFLLIISALIWILNHPPKISATASSPINEVTSDSSLPLLPQAASTPASEVTHEELTLSPALEHAVASRLSFELSSIPLPNSLRIKPRHLSPATPKPALISQQASAVNAPPPMQEQVNPNTSVNTQFKTESPKQLAENEFRQAYLLAQQGQLKEAAAGYARALKLDANHDMARQSLIAVLLESKLNNEAEKVLRDTLLLNPKNTHYAMLLARLQVERNALPLALDTLNKALPFADQQADYQAFVAALQQRQNRHKEAVTHYQKALQLSPNAGLWLMGLGISLQALQRKEEALDAYQQAMSSHKLSPDLEAFVTQRIKEVKH